jgi:RND family efflux transporter MFP subunit
MIQRRRMLAGLATTLICVSTVCISVSCRKAAQAEQAGGMPAFPVKVEKVELRQIGDTSEFLATLQSRNAAVLQPEVEGQITRIFLAAGARVEAGQAIMEIDPRRQQANVSQQEATRTSQQATLAYTKSQLERSRKLFEAGIISRQEYDNAVSAHDASRANVDATEANISQQKVQLHYFTVRAPSAGVLGDIPVRVGDRVTNTTLLTTIDHDGELEAYINVPSERAAEVHQSATQVELLNEDGTVALTTRVNFISPRVDTANQLLLIKAPVPNGDRRFRNDQVLHARVVWKQISKPMVPVTAMSRLGAQSFVFVIAQGPRGASAAQKPVKLGALVGNDYVIEEGLNPGDTVIVGGTQNLVDGMPVIPQA